MDNPLFPPPDGGASGLSVESESGLMVDGLEALRGIVDREFVSTGWFEVEQSRIQSFAETTKDLQWIHLDVVRARTESPFKATVAHGFLTLSLLSYFMNEALVLRVEGLFGVNYGMDKVRFPSPVRAGDFIRGRFRLQSLTEVAGGYQASYLATIDIQGGAKPGCVAEWLVRYYTASPKG